MHPPHRRLIRKIKQLRGEKDLPQEALAKKAGRSLGCIARLEIGRHDPSLRTPIRLAEALKVTVGALVE